jgi:hypothetical protein
MHNSPGTDGSNSLNTDISKVSDQSKTSANFLPKWERVAKIYVTIYEIYEKSNFTSAR